MAGNNPRWWRKKRKKKPSVYSSLGSYDINKASPLITQSLSCSKYKGSPVDYSIGKHRINIYIQINFPARSTHRDEWGD